MTQNELFEIVAETLKNKNEVRMVVKYNDDKDTTMLLDFSDCGMPFKDNCICTWCLQQDEHDTDGNFIGTKELGFGMHFNFASLFTALYNILIDNDCEFQMESF